MIGGDTAGDHPLRVAVADDAVLLREGIGQILRAGGVEVAASVDTAEELLRNEGIQMLSTTHASIEEISSRVLEVLGLNREMF